MYILNEKKSESPFHTDFVEVSDVDLQRKKLLFQPG